MGNPKKWTMAEGEWQNGLAEANLGHFKGNTRESRREASQLARHVAATATALLELAYCDRLARQEADVDRWVKTLLAYRSPRGTRMDAPHLFASTRLTSRDLALLHGELRRMLAHLVLGYDDEPGGRWWYGPECRESMVYVRQGPSVLFDLGQLDPVWVRAAVNAGGVLGDAMPWIRSCKLCGKLFFKVGAQLTCSREHTKVLGARKEGRSTLGRPRQDYSSAIVATHNRWIELLTGRVKQSQAARHRTFKRRLGGEGEKVKPEAGR